MRGKHVFTLLFCMFFLGACCQTDTSQDRPGAQLRPPHESPEPAPAAFGGPGNAAPGAAALFDVVPRALQHIPVGTVIGKEAPKYWTNLILFATPTLSEEDLRDSPKMAAHYARMFKFTLLANVVASQ